MISVGYEYTGRMADSTILGAGVAKIDGLAVFVNGAAAEDVCRFKITEVKKNFAFAELVEIIEDSPYKLSFSDMMAFSLSRGIFSSVL